MVKIEPINSTCGCESCSSRRYNTRSVSKSCAKKASGIPQSADPVPLVEESHRVQIPTPEPETQGPISTVHVDKSQLVSKLLDSITRFWSLVILDEALTLSQGRAGETQDKPVSPTTVTNDTTSKGESRYNSSSCLPKPCEYHDADEPPADAALSIEEDPEVRDYTPTPDTKSKPTRFKFDSLLLSEELKKFRIWKATFSNDELNRLPAIQDEVAQGVLKCLTDVANTLIKGYNEWLPSSESGRLEPKKESLRLLVEQVETGISEASIDDEVMTDFGDFSETQESYLTTENENETLLKTLKFEIERLNALSHSLRLGLSNGIIFTTYS
ncbi:hypothetical protein BGZ63DRAFT_364669 [Mariannaea sp. PMI_226]|nr:hypothetical protein BGZ63DRAFT_364669 [Mariannaea sp. PMI_226]